MSYTILPKDQTHQRIDWLDIAKCLAISLVVVGHLLQNRVAIYDENLIFKLIYMFHMPLFFYIAGITCQIKLPQGFLSNIANSSKRLLIPFFIWYLIPPLYLSTLSLDISNTVASLQKLYQHPDNGLWFLWVLFIYQVANALTTFFKFKYQIHPAFTYIAITIFLMGTVTQFEYLGIKLVLKHMPYFLAGLIHEKLFGLLKKKSTFTLIILAFMFFSISFFWERNLNDLADNLKQAPATLIASNNIALIIALLMTLSAAFLGIILTFKVVLFVSSVNAAFFNKIRKYSILIGQRSMEIYVLHFYLLDICIFPKNIWVDVFAATILILSCCLFFAFFIRNYIPKLTLPLFGFKINQ